MEFASNARLAGCLTLLVTLMTSGAARAGGYTFETLATFENSPTTGIVIGLDGGIYGATSGNPGSFYRIDAQTGSFNALASFGGAAGSFPFPGGGLVMDASGDIFGTTYTGGANGFGTVYRIDAQTGTITTLADLDDSIGRSSAGVSLDASGNIYGIAIDAYNVRHVFKVDAQTGSLTSLADLANSTSFDYAPTLDASGNLYGVTINGGAGGFGSIFRIDAVTHEVTTVHSFGPEDAYAYAPVTFDNHGNMYGVTRSTVYSIDEAGTFRTLANTASNPLLSGNYNPVVLDTEGNLYFNTYGDPYNGAYGTIQRIVAGTGILETIFTFDDINGFYPQSLAIGSDGTIYGTVTGETGSGQYDIVFRLSPTSAAVPEPAAIAMLAVGAVAVAAVAVRGRSRG